MCKIFLDDIREPKDCIGYMHKRIGSMNPIYLEDWLIARNYNEFVDLVTKNIDQITHISFDHDLADEHYDPKMYSDDKEYTRLYSGFNEKTGYDCAIWLRRFYTNNNKKLPVMFVHSMNPVGTQNIIDVFR